MTLYGKMKLKAGMQLRPVTEGKKREFTQAEMFGICSRLPASESLMPVRIPESLLPAWMASSLAEYLNGTGGSLRTGEYAVYKRGFEKDLSLPIGEKVVYVENGIHYTFEVPDVKCPGADIYLRQAAGMLVLPISKLRYSGDTADRVSVSQDFNPATDVRVVDVMRPRGWAQVDENGYPLRTNPAKEKAHCALNSQVRHSDEFTVYSTGWHGSLALSGYDSFPYRGSAHPRFAVRCVETAACFTASDYNLPTVEGYTYDGPYNFVARHLWSELAEVAVMGPTWMTRVLTAFGESLDKNYAGPIGQNLGNMYNSWYPFGF